MTRIRNLAVVLYTAIALGANLVFAPMVHAADPADMIPASVPNFQLHDAPQPVPLISFLAADGSTIDFSAFAGKTLVVNFWATWCAPCRAEMPSLEKLQIELGDEAFQVVTIAAGHNPPEMIDKFLARDGLENLTKHRDPKMELAQAMQVVGLPVTVILNPQGQEIARLSGEADWASADMLALIRALKAHDATTN